MRTTHRVFLSSFLVFFLIAGGIAACAQTALQFVPVPACRVVDTRLPMGTFGGPAIPGGSFRTFPIPQGACAIPTTAAAYSINVTVVPHGTLAYLEVWPAGETRPANGSTLNSVDGRIKANAAIVAAGTPNEAISVYATNTTDVVLDINGYFTSATASALAYYPITPCRVADTRNANGELGGPHLLANTERDFPILDSSCIPQGVTPTAYSLNFTVVPYPSGQELGWLKVWPYQLPQQLPPTSTLNNPTGTVVANAAIVAAGTDGEVAVYPNGTTNLIIDIDGYFAPPAAHGLALYTVTPCRVLDTRNDGGPFNGERTINVQESPCGLPPTAEAYVLNATVVPQGSLGFLALWEDGQPRPNPYSTLNAQDGALTSNMAIVATDNGKIDAYAQGSTQLVLDTGSYFAPTNGALSGPYAFSFNGFMNGKPLFMAGSFVADGNGHIVSGVIDLNSGVGSATLGYPLTGGSTYSIGSDGIGTMSFNTESFGTFNFQISVSNLGNGTLIQNNTDPNTRGSGVFYVQTPSQFVVPNGGYAGGAFGSDQAFNRYAKAGAFTTNSTGNVTAGVEDDNDNGALTHRSFTGQFLTPVTSTGRGLASLSFPNDTTNTYAYYVVSKSQYILVGIDPLTAQDPLTVGSILSQTTNGFTNGSLNGVSTLEVSSVAPNGGSPEADVVLGFFTADGQGNATTSLDENKGGTLTQQQVSQGTYSVASNG
jgi:hypothetical protein